MYPQAAIEAATTVVDTLDAADAIQVIAFDKSTIGPAFFIARVVQAYSKAPCLPTRDLNMCNVLQVIDFDSSARNYRAHPTFSIIMWWFPIQIA